MVFLCGNGFNLFNYLFNYNQVWFEVSLEVLGLFLFVPVIAFVDFLVFGQPESAKEAWLNRGWRMYLIPTFLEFFFFIVGYFVGKGVL